MQAPVPGNDRIKKESSIFRRSLLLLFHPGQLPRRGFHDAHVPHTAKKLLQPDIFLSGIPVATVAINGGANAGLLAAKILATSDPELLARLKAYSQELKEQVEAKDAKLQEVGHKAYTK